MAWEVTMAAKKCIDCGIRNARPDTPEGRLCNPCYDYASWENEHNDNGHEDGGAGADLSLERINCPVCHPELDPRSDKPRTGHTNTRAHTWTSHAEHYHARTPEDRAKCRKLIKTTGKPYDARKKK
jgi:hypothetical protein